MPDDKATPETPPDPAAQSQTPGPIAESSVGDTQAEANPQIFFNGDSTAFETRDG